MATLQKTIRELLYSADHSKIAVSAELKHGLHLHVRKKGHAYIFTIYRLGVSPSVQEWNTCIAHWPYQIGAVNWSAFGITRLGNHYKQGYIPEESENGTQQQG